MPALPRTRFSMRWWLALVFAGIAALTAVVVAQVFRSNSESAIRDRAAELTAGTAVAGASRVAAAPDAIAARRVAADFATRRRIALFVFDDEGRLLTSDRVAGVDLDDVRDLETALGQALDGRRYVETDGETGAVTVALPIRGSDRFGAIVAFANRPDLEDALGIVRDEILDAALRATLVGALIGLVVAVLITRRLRRIASAAAAVEQGQFEGVLRSGFPDELGALAQTVDHMREHLARSFADLEGERDRLRRLLEQLQEAVVAVDRSLRIVFANSRARQLLGADAREGRLLRDPWPGVGLRPLVTGLFGPDAGSTSLTIRPNADTTLVIAGLPPSRGSDIAVLVLTDVTQRERRERAEREFVANAAHELRTPLTAIGSAVDVLQAGAKDDAEQRNRFIEVIERQSQRLNGLVDALLTLARAQTGTESVRLEVVRLSPLLASVGDDAEQGGRKLTIDCEPGLAALAHPELLRQALVNLVENAFTHGGGNDVVLSGRGSGETVVVAVSDTGPGMASSEIKRVLDRFYRSPNGGGYGLGLAIVREVARAIDGKVSISTEPGTGTTVALELARAVME
jgi:signal transduction histidine kinase